MSPTAVAGYFHRDTSSANSGSKFSRLLDVNHRVSQGQSNFADVKSNRMQLIEEFLLFIQIHLKVSLFFHRMRLAISRGKIDPKFVEDESVVGLSIGNDGITRVRRVFASYVIVIYTPPQRTRHPRNARTHSSASPFVRRRALRRCTVTQRAPLGNMRWL